MGGANYFDQIIDDSTIDGFYNGNLAEVSGHDGGGANYFKGDISNSNITGSYINNTAWSGGANFILGNIQNSKITGIYTQNTAKNAGGANHFRGKIIKSDINGKYNNNRAGTGGANYFDEIIIDSIINGTYYANVADLGHGHFTWTELKFLMSGGANYFKSGGANYFKSDIWNTLITGDYNNNIAYSSGGANFFNGNIDSSIIDGIYKNNERTAGLGNCNYFTYLQDVIITGTYYTPSLPHGEGVDCIKSFSKDGLSKYFSYINNPRSTFSDNRTYIWSLYVNASAKVNQNSSEGNGLSPERPFKTLNEALNVVQDGATIFIAPGTYTGKGQNVDLIINKNLNLQTYGTGDVIFDAESKSRIWTVNASNLNITGITFQNGKSSYGGAIYFNNIIYNSRISGKFINNNATTGNGSAMYFQEAISSLITGKYINNTNYFKKENLSTFYKFNDTITTLNNDSTVYVLNNIIYVNCHFLPGLSSNGYTEFLKGDGYTPFTAFKTLLDAVNAAKDGDIIQIAEGNYTGYGNVEDMNINKNLTIMNDGKMVIFDAKDTQNRIWTITASQVNILGITFTNGKSSHGGALLFKNKLVNSVIASNFINNRVYTITKTCYGGAIAFESSLDNVTITGTFLNNSVYNWKIEDEWNWDNSMYYYLYGGAISFAGNVTNCNISGVYMDNHIDVTDKSSRAMGGVFYFASWVINTTITGDYALNSITTPNAALDYRVILGEGDKIWYHEPNHNAPKELASSGGVLFIKEGSMNLTIDGIYLHNMAGYGAVHYFGGDHYGLIVDGKYANNHAVTSYDRKEGKAGWLKALMTIGEYYYYHPKVFWGVTIAIGVALIIVAATAAYTIASATAMADAAAIAAAEKAKTTYLAQEEAMGTLNAMDKIINKFPRAENLINNALNAYSKGKDGIIVFNAANKWCYQMSLSEKSYTILESVSLINEWLDKGYNFAIRVSTLSEFVETLNSIKSAYSTAYAATFAAVHEGLMVAGITTAVVGTLTTAAVTAKLIKENFFDVSSPEQSDFLLGLLDNSALYRYFESIPIESLNYFRYIVAGTELAADLVGIPLKDLDLPKRLTNQSLDELLSHKEQKTIDWSDEKYWTGYGINYFAGALHDVEVRGAYMHNTAIPYNTNTRSNINDDHSIYGILDESNMKIVDENGNYTSEMFKEDLIRAKNNNKFVVNGSINKSNPNQLTFKTLQEALNHIRDGDTIWIAPGIYNGTGNVGLTIKNNIGLVKYGDGDVIFDGQKTSQIFNVISSRGLNITGLTFINGNSIEGGAIRFNQLINSYINATFISNNADYGGALFINNKVYNSTIMGTYINNTAEKLGGGNYFIGSVSHSEIGGIYVGNHALHGGANAIGFIENTSVCGQYINNTAQWDGGALYFFDAYHNVKLNCSYKNNSALDGADYFFVGNGHDSKNDDPYIRPHPKYNSHQILESEKVFVANICDDIPRSMNIHFSNAMTSMNGVIKDSLDYSYINNAIYYSGVEESIEYMPDEIESAMSVSKNIDVVSLGLLCVLLILLSMVGIHFYKKKNMN